MWKRVAEWVESAETLYHIVIPAPDRADQKALLRTLGDQTYQLWTVDHADLQTASMALVLWLPQTQCVYVECIALHPSIRGRHLSVPYWTRLRDELAHVFPAAKWVAIQAYLKNVPFFTKHYGWAEGCQDVNGNEAVRQQYCPTPVLWLFGSVAGGEVCCAKTQVAVAAEHRAIVHKMGYLFECFLTQA